MRTMRSDDGSIHAAIAADGRWPSGPSRASSPQMDASPRGSGALPSLVDILLQLERAGRRLARQWAALAARHGRFVETRAERLIELSADGRDYRVVARCRRGRVRHRLGTVAERHARIRGADDPPSDPRRLANGEPPPVAAHDLELAGASGQPRLGGKSRIGKTRGSVSVSGAGWNARKVA